MCSTPGTFFELSYSAKRHIVSKCTTDLSSRLLSRSSVCLACRQETGFRVSVHSRRSWGNVEKGWGFWGFHKRGSRNLFETILHKQTRIQRANRVWNRQALSSNDQIYVPGCLFAAPEQRKGGFSVIKRLGIASCRNRLKSPETNHKQNINQRDLWTVRIAEHSGRTDSKATKHIIIHFRIYFVEGVAVRSLLHNISLAVLNSSVS